MHVFKDQRTISSHIKGWLVHPFCQVQVASWRRCICLKHRPGLDVRKLYPPGCARCLGATHLPKTAPHI
eukprot:1156980-Pelagomonas_calceolata.AAC.2